MPGDFVNIWVHALSFEKIMRFVSSCLLPKAVSPGLTPGMPFGGVRTLKHFGHVWQNTEKY
jgi:hypothetical protein